MRVMGWVMARPAWYERAGRLARWGLRHGPRWLLMSRLNPWARERELPEAPAEAFRDWYRKHRGRGPVL
jgi:L-lactate dehydrogenase complex protein LldF